MQVLTYMCVTTNKQKKVKNSICFYLICEMTNSEMLHFRIRLYHSRVETALSQHHRDFPDGDRVFLVNANVSREFAFSTAVGSRVRRCLNHCPLHRGYIETR